MRLLVTRPDEDAKALVERLKVKGHEIISSPLFSIRYLDGAVIPPLEYQAILATSANGVRALARRKEISLFALPLLAVGNATASAAHEAGFIHIRSADGNVESLTELSMRAFAPEDGPLLHAAGSIVAGDLKGMLEREGFHVERVTLYEAHAVDRLSDAVLNAVKQGSLDGALFYSPRSARIFAQLAVDAGLQSQFGKVTAYCLSKPVADALKALSFSKLAIASRPTQEALLALLPS